MGCQLLDVILDLRDLKLIVVELHLGNFEIDLQLFLVGLRSRISKSFELSQELVLDVSVLIFRLDFVLHFLKL